MISKARHPRCPATPARPSTSTCAAPTIYLLGVLAVVVDRLSAL